MAEIRGKAPTTIDDLPEEVLVHILSFRTTLDAVRTSLISPKWRNLWHHVPSLNFDMAETLRRDDYFNPDNFTDFISETLFTRPKTCPLHAFRLSFNSRHRHRDRIQVGSWIRHAITSGATFLRLHFFEDFDRFRLSISDFQFHFSDLKNRCSVKILDLQLCQIVWPVSVPANGFSSISSISLHNVLLNDEVLFALVLTCVKLEFLSLSYLHGVQNFKIHSQTLKELELMYHPTDLESLSIRAPKLLKIGVYTFSVAKYCSMDLSSLVKACLTIERGEEDLDCQCCDFLQIVSGVERLSMVKLLYDKDFPCGGFYIKNRCRYPMFKNLKYLKLKTGFREDDLEGIASILEKCPQLETLVLNFDSESHKERSFEGCKTKPLIFSIPSLKRVKMKSFCGSSMEMYFVELLKSHKVVLEKIVAFPVEVNGRLPPPFVLFDNFKR